MDDQSQLELMDDTDLLDMMVSSESQWRSIVYLNKTKRDFHSNLKNFKYLCRTIDKKI